MYKKSNDKGDVQASYTVETALIMGMLISALVVGIYCGFYWYNRVTIGAQSYQKVIEIVWDQVDDKNLQKELEELLLMADSVAVECLVNSEKARVLVKANATVPYISRGLKLQREVELSVQDSVDTIINVRRVKKLTGELG